MAKNKGTRILITLECTECRSNLNKRSIGISRYHTEKNRRNNPERLELKKDGWTPIMNCANNKELPTPLYRLWPVSCRLDRLLIRAVATRGIGKDREKERERERD